MQKQSLTPRVRQAIGSLAAALLCMSAALILPFTVFAQSAQTPAPTGSVVSTPKPDTNAPTTAASPTLNPASPAPTAPVVVPAPTATVPTAPVPMVAVPTLTVTLTDGAKSPVAVQSHSSKVADLLTEQKVMLGAWDKITPAPTAALKDGQNITIKRIDVQTSQEKVTIPFHAVFKMSREVAPGRIQTGRRGVPGVRVRTYAATYVNGTLSSRKLVSSTLTRPPVMQETLAGIRTREARALPSRGGAYTRLRCLTMTATGYSPYEGSAEGLCATGMHAGYGVVAVDPRVIRLHTRLYIEGYGYAIAGDTGGAIKGNRIDLGHTTFREAADVGRHRVKVWILSPQR